MRNGCMILQNSARQPGDGCAGATFSWLLLRSLKLPVTDIREVAGNGGGRRHHGTDEMGASASSLAAFEVAVAGGSASLAGLQDVRVHAQTHGTARLAPLETGFLENPIKTLPLRRLLHRL